MSDGASEDELRAGLVQSFGTGDVTVVERRPYEYATSFPLHELVVEVAGERVQLIVKDLAWERLLPAARSAKPAFLHDPQRAIRAQSLAAGAGFAPVVHAAGDDWILMEKVAGVELWQVGEHEVWWEVARALARFHRRFADDAGELRAACPQLLCHDEASFRLWAARAVEALAGSDDPRASELVAAVGGYSDVVRQMAATPATFVHGEFFASNVMVAGPGAQRVLAVDWELAATGPGALDLAAVSVGWDDEIRRGFLDAYHEEWAQGCVEDLAATVDGCLVHLSLQWLGWADGWQPPGEHRRDWLGEALAAAGRLGL